MKNFWKTLTFQFVHFHASKLPVFSSFIPSVHQPCHTYGIYIRLHQVPDSYPPVFPGWDCSYGHSNFHKLDILPLEAQINGLLSTSLHSSKVLSYIQHLVYSLLVPAARTSMAAFQLLLVFNQLLFCINLGENSEFKSHLDCYEPFPPLLRRL